jgi:hypothetical protein
MSSRRGGGRRVERQVRRADDLALRHQDRALDGVVELADVAGPGVAAHARRGLLVEPGDRLAVALDVLLQEMLGEEVDVLAALAQRRQVDLDRVEAEEEVLAECPRRPRRGGRRWSPR